MLRNVCAGLALTVLLLSTAAWADALGEAKITELSGKVEILRGGQADRAEAAAVGATLSPGDAVRTGVDSSATIEMGSGNTARLESNSTLKVGSRPNAPKLNLLGGKLLGRLRKIPKGEKVHVGTPTSIAGIEGTTFSVSVSSGGATEVDVLTGSVRVQSAGEPGKYTRVTQMHRVRVSNWENTFFTATGSGLAPERYKRPKIREGQTEVLVVRASGIGKPVEGAAGPDAAKRTAEEAATDAALRELAQRVLRAKVGEDKTVEDLASKDQTLYQRISGLVAGATVKKRQMLGDGQAQVTVELTISDLNATLGLKKPVFTSAMVQLSQDQYNGVFTPRARLTAEQAAKTVADRNLLEQIQGILITSETSVEDFALRNDEISGKVQGVIRGAETVGVRYFSDGTVEVTRRVKGMNVRIDINAVTKKDTLGERYLGKPSEIDPLWYETLRRFNSP